MVRNSEKVHSISAENRELKFILIWDNRTSSQGSKLLLPVIKASEVKIKHQTKGIEAEQKRKKTKNFWYPAKKKSSLGRMAQTPRARTGDSVGRFCRDL